MNQIMDVDDFKRMEWKSVLNEMHDLMRIPRRRRGLVRHCTDRRSIFGRAEIESYKHWEYPWLLKYGEFKPGMSVLDCGCGRGFMQIYLSLRGCRVSSIDISTLKSRWVQTFWKWAKQCRLPFR